MSEKKLFLLDAYALIYRSYYAFIRTPRINSKGLNTSAVFGFINTLNEVLKLEKPSHIAVVFDPPDPSFRKNIYQEYKANREAMPEDLRTSIPYIKELIKAYNIPVIQIDTFEADDVIGTLAKMAEKEGFTVYMMTPDKDYCQLVSENIFMYKPRRSGNDVEVWGVKEVQEKFKVTNPVNVIDVLSLWGDSSDNIPGAPGIGEKTAKSLMEKYSNLENLYANLNDLKGKQKENLNEYKEQVMMAKRLVTIELEVPVEFNPEELKVCAPDFNVLRELFEVLEFRSLEPPKPVAVAQVPVSPVKGVIFQGSLFADADFNQKPTAPVQSEFKDVSKIVHNYFLVESQDDHDLLISRLLNCEEFCFDTETTGLDANNTELVGISFCLKSHEAYYISMPVDKKETLKLLGRYQPVFSNEKSLKIGQNIKFDILVLNQYDIAICGKLFDTMLAHYLIQPEMRHNLVFLSETYLNYKPVSIEELIGKKGKNQGNMRNVPLEKITEYAAEDADLTFQLKRVFEPLLLENGFSQLFSEVEMPLIQVLAHMEKTGVRLNSAELDMFAIELRKNILEIEAEIHKDAGFPFNIGSPKQLGEVLFDRLKLDPNAKKTKTHHYSTGEEILAKLVHSHPIIPKILEFRSLMKLLSTYVDALPKLINPRTDRIHTSYNQAVTSTGRLSSTNPNLQNIPIREERGKEMRRAFIPSANRIFLSADYSQVELRLMAHMSNDRNMIEAFRNSADIHTATASKIYNIPESEVSKEMRSKAKTANFGIIYGISAFGLSQRLNINRKEAKELIDNYFITYPDVKTYMDSSITIARKKGYVETILGRKRYLADINSRNGMIRSMAERNAINAPIQGSAADMIKVAMVNIFRQMKTLNMKSTLIIQVHDELDFDVVPDELEELKTIVRQGMQSAIELKVPLIVDIGVGKNWMEAH